MPSLAHTEQDIPADGEEHDSELRRVEHPELRANQSVSVQVNAQIVEIETRVAAAIDALRADQERRSGRLSWSDVYRIVARRKFPPHAIATLFDAMRTAGLQPDDDEVPTRQREIAATITSHRDRESWVLQQLCSTPTFSLEEEASLTRCYWSNHAIASEAPGTPSAIAAADAAQRARDEIVRANMRLVVHVAKSFRVPEGTDLLDLVQEGTLGLLRAVELYDPTKGFKFSTYAVWWIRQAIARALANTARLIRLPMHLQGNLARIRRGRHRLAQTLARAPTYEELAQETGLARSDIVLLDEVVSIPHSLDVVRASDKAFDIPDERQPEPENETELRDLDRDELVAVMHAAIQLLKPAQREVLRLRWGLDGNPEMTLEQVGREFGITRERVRQIERKALERLAYAESGAGKVLRDFADP